MNSRRLINAINLLNVHGLGPLKVRQLVSAFPEQDIFGLSVSDLCRVEKIDIKNAQAIKSYSQMDHGKRELDRIHERSLSVLSYWDDDYPLLLQKIYDPPVLLYTAGQPLKRKEDTLAVVGTRTPTVYGGKVTGSLVRDLVSNGMVVVSGMALGIDTYAHEEAVKQGGRTIAVLGSGLDVIYPRSNRGLFSRILEKGTVISEFPLGTGPDAGNFPQRNRIISGLSHGTIIVEAGNRSGAILTALNAVDQNRDVFAVPGRIYDPQSQGCLRLIRNGAYPVTSAEEVLKSINAHLFRPLRLKQQELKLDLTEDESQLIRSIGHDPIHVDDLVYATKIDLTHLLNLLLHLELKGAIQQLSGKQFVRV